MFEKLKTLDALLATPGFNDSELIEPEPLQGHQVTPSLDKVVAKEPAIAKESETDDLEFYRVAERKLTYLKIYAVIASVAAVYAVGNVLYSAFMAGEDIRPMIFPLSFMGLGMGALYDMYRKSGQSALTPYH